MAMHSAERPLGSKFGWPCNWVVRAAMRSVVALFLGGVLGELLCHGLGREASCSVVGSQIAQEEDQFGGERLVEDLDDASAVCAVGVGTAP